MANNNMNQFNHFAQLSSIGQNKMPVLIPDEYHTWTLRVIDYLSEFCGEDGETLVQYIEGDYKLPVVATSTAETEKEKTRFEKIQRRSLRILRQWLPTNIFTKFATIDDARKLWKQLEVVYGVNKKQKSSKVTQILSEFKSFTQKPDESLDQMFERFTTILNKMEMLGQEFPKDLTNVAFIQALRKE